MQSLADECTPLKKRYDACFNLWFEGYLQPALDGAAAARAAPAGYDEPEPSPTPASSGSTPSLGAGSPSPAADTPPVQERRRLITSWSYSSAFRTRVHPAVFLGAAEPIGPDDMVSAQHVHVEDDEEHEPLDTTGMTRAQVKAAQYERQCGKVWREYQGCLRKAIGQNQNLTTLLEQAREEHPLHAMDGLEGTPWDGKSHGDKD